MSFLIAKVGVDSAQQSSHSVLHPALPVAFYGEVCVWV